MEKFRKKYSEVYLITLFKLITVDEIGVDELGVDKMEVHVYKSGSRQVHWSISHH